MNWTLRFVMVVMLTVAACNCGNQANTAETLGARPQVATGTGTSQRARTSPFVAHASAAAGTVRSHVRGDFNGNGFADILVSRTDGPPPIDYGDVYASGPEGISRNATQTISAGQSCGLGPTVPVRIGDVNGDGFGDLAVPWPSGHGSVIIRMGSEGGLRPEAVTITADTEVGSCFGHAVAAGDVDGDGKSDLIVGAPRVHDNAGRVYVFRGNGEGFDATPFQTIDGPDGANSRFGSSLAACDMNGDGHDDVIVGAPLTANHHGRAFILSVTPSATLLRMDADDVTPDANNSFWEVGDWVTAVRGPNRCDAVIAADGVSLHALYMVRSGHLQERITLPRPTNADGVDSLSVGDLDGDGNADLVVSGVGAVRAHHGSATGIRQEVWFSLSPTSPQWWGAGAAIPGDVDGDGKEDLVVGDREHARIYFGAANGVRSDALILSPELGANMGRGVWVL